LVYVHEQFKILTSFFLNYVPHPENIKDVHWNKALGQDFRMELAPLYIAASIDRTVCYWGIADDAGLWNRIVYEYDVVKAEFSFRIVEEASRFIWSWPSFETFIKMCQNSINKHPTGKAI